jgi:hypothetical protein
MHKMTITADLPNALKQGIMPSSDLYSFRGYPDPPENGSDQVAPFSRGAGILVLRFLLQVFAQGTFLG